MYLRHDCSFVTVNWWSHKVSEPIGVSWVSCSCLPVMVSSVHVAYFMSKGVIASSAALLNNSKVNSICNGVKVSNSTTISTVGQQKGNVSTHSLSIKVSIWKMKMELHLIFFANAILLKISTSVWSVNHPNNGQNIQQPGLVLKNHLFSKKNWMQESHDQRK